MSAFEQDITVKRYEDYATLADYCTRSANPVGRLMLHLFDAASPQDVAESDAICTGLQLVNFWQDVRVDWHKQVARARERIAIDAAEHAARRAEIAAAAAEGNIVGDYSDEVALQRQRENEAGQGQDHSLTQL